VTVRFEPGSAGTHTCTIETGNGLCEDVWLTGDRESDLRILSIIDVANDQGRAVRIHFARSVYDGPGSPFPIIQYEAFRRIDPLPSGSSPQSGGPGDAEAVVSAARESGMLSDTSILLSDWEFAGAVPAHGELEYNMIAPTLADSTIANGMHWSVFFIRAATSEPLTFFDSPVDSGYSLDNLAPGAPENLAVAYNSGGGNELSWDPSEDEDFDYFCVYRSLAPDFTPTPDDLVHTTVDASWTDGVPEGWKFSYKITAVDFSGNESPPAAPATLTGVENGMPPQAFALYQNVPNPFNPSTMIRFDVPAGGGNVTLTIYDVNGRHVRTLVDTRHSAGQKSVTWNGDDATGRRVASGVYFYRLTAPGFAETRKLIVLK
jgi:hypothetical protein